MSHTGQDVSAEDAGETINTAHQVARPLPLSLCAAREAAAKEPGEYGHTRRGPMTLAFAVFFTIRDKIMSI